MRTAGVLYPGDMGSAVTRRLVAHGWRVVSCLVGRSERTSRAAHDAGIKPLTTLEAVVAQSDLVISLVPQAAVVETAQVFAEGVRRAGTTPVYLDANSVSPKTMAVVESTVAAVGVQCVDGAFVGSADLLHGPTTLYVSGSNAETVGCLIGTAFRVHVLDGPIGFASAFKLSFSGFNKGLVALFLEVAAAGDAIGQQKELIDCLRAFYPGALDTVARLLPTYPRHCARRAEEMGELVSWFTTVGQSAPMAAGAREVLEAFTMLGLPSDVSWSPEELVSEVTRRRLLSRREDCDGEFR
jgi:3-hydroxyisobutyrate dehydrogenase-like beta-hydroxyacid dehydrogenase